MSISTPVVPYSTHIEQIRKALWQGRASVMVGSGFSLNATPVHGATRPFPLWRHLVDRLWQELHGRPRTPNDAVDPLRLAEEYALTAGATALDDLLLDLIPDNDYDPGPLHSLLLELRWTDVFTTNYDTLLERASRKVYRVQYDTVYNQADIARTRRPRIVKLHGSFPSHRPFIATAEHYRTYPRRFAAFVNMVQQSIMENAFCMIGFSGDDPNFIQWAGWVRDQLGEAAPKIYFFDVLDLAQNPAKERVYQSMRVIPIDLGPVVPASLWTGEVRRQKALEWLMLSLHNGEPADLSRWPDGPTRKPLPPLSEGLPELLSAPDVPKIPDLSRPPEDALDQGVLERFRDEICRIRDADPGWRVLPELNRQRLVGKVAPWLSEKVGAGVANVISAMPLPDRARILAGFVWAHSRLLLPLTPWLQQLAISLLESMNPKPEVIDLSGVQPKPEVPPDQGDELTSIWVDLAFALVTDAWQEQRDDVHTLWMKRLSKVVQMRPMWRARFWFERCWSHLLRFEEDELRTALREWPEDFSFPFWEAKRAALYADLGDLDTARGIAEKALDRVRRATAAPGASLASLSEEGWIVGLLREICLAGLKVEGHLIDSYNERLRALSGNACDPTEDGRIRGQELAKRLAQRGKRKTLSFDPGGISIVHRFGSWLGEDWVIAQTLHDAPWPLFRTGALLGSYELMAEFVRSLFSSPRLAVALAAHMADKYAVDTLLRRSDVPRQSKAVAADIASWMLGVIKGAMRRSAQSSSASRSSAGMRERALRACPEILSRISMHLTGDDLGAAMDVAIDMYRHEFYRERFERHELVANMFRRIMLSATPVQVLVWMPRLLALPIVGDDGFSVNDRFGEWPEPMAFIVSSGDLPHPTENERGTWAALVPRLVQCVREGASDVRKRASRRLFILHRLGGLDDKQGQAFISALWNSTESSFPKDLGFEPSALLLLPERQEGETRKAVARYLVSLRAGKDHKAIFRWVVQATAQAWHPDEEYKRRISWAAEEAEQMLGRLEEIWRLKSLPKASDADLLADEHASYACSFVLCLGIAVIPSLAVGGSQDAKRRVFDLLASVEGQGYLIVEALPALLLLDSGDKPRIERRILDALYGPTEEHVRQATGALWGWANLFRAGMLEQIPSHLLDAWVGIVVSRRMPGLSHAVLRLCLFVEHFGDLLNESHCDALCAVLGYLAQETEIRSDPDPQDELPLTPEERVALRGHASRLAAHIAADYRKRGLVAPPEIERWRDLATVDTLPEVRRVWASSSQPTTR